MDNALEQNRPAASDPAPPVEQVNVSLDVVWHGTAGKYDARLSEISLEGCFIDSMGQETLGETISFNVRLPSGIWVKLEGEVISREYPIGFEVRFTHLIDENRRMLMQVIAAHGGKQAQESLEVTDLTARPGKHRVLVADDDPVTLRILAAIAEALNYEVVTAVDGREALKILQRDGDFSCAIFDMMMPHLDGMDLIHYLKNEARLAHIPIGMITGEQDPKIWDESVAAGASVFLPKPFSPPQVQMMLRVLVNKSSGAGGP